MLWLKEEQEHIWKTIYNKFCFLSIKKIFCESSSQSSMDCSKKKIVKMHRVDIIPLPHPHSFHSGNFIYLPTLQFEGSKGVTRKTESTAVWNPSQKLSFHTVLPLPRKSFPSLHLSLRGLCCLQAELSCVCEDHTCQSQSYTSLCVYIQLYFSVCSIVVSTCILLSLEHGLLLIPWLHIVNLTFPLELTNGSM